MALLALYDVPAPAKLNLFLHVEGQRDDGFHLLDSLMVPIDWCDTLHFELRRDGCIARRDLGLPLPADDLCTRAARALQQASATSFGAEIGIVKRIPWGAGLGGGSSDAASTLLALNRLWALDWPLDALMPIGLALGADVPFFLGAGPARVGGIGERLQTAAFAPGWYAVVKPEGALSTEAVFASSEVADRVAAARIAGFSEGPRVPKVPPEAAAGSGIEDQTEVDIRGQRGIEGERVCGGHELPGRNDLQAAAEVLCPDVAVAGARLREVFGNSRMTGSGSAVFASVGPVGAVVTGGKTQDVASCMPGDWPPGWASRMCRSLEVHPLAGWARRQPRRFQVRGASREPV